MRLSLATILCPKITRRNCMVACALALVWMFGERRVKMTWPLRHHRFELEKFRGSVAVESLLSGMTLDDKVGEMTQLTLNMLCAGELSEKPGVYVVLDEPHALDESKLHAAFQEGRIGSVLNCGGHCLSDRAMARTRFWNPKASIAAKGIPTLYGVDAIHGATYTSGAALGPVDALATT